MRFLLGFAAGLIGAILGGRMAWPRDKRRIISMNDGRIKVSKPWNPAVSPTLCRILDELGIRFDVVTRVQGALLVVEVDPEGDAKVVALWDEISDLRARYIDARQRSLATQTSFLKERA